MTGSAAATNMQEFDFTNTWKTVSGDYPILAWQSQSSGNTPPTASFLYSPSNPEVGNSVELNASYSSDTDGTILTYEWDTDGDGTFEASSESSTYSFTYYTPGDYTVTLSVIDDGGATDSTSKTITIDPTSSDGSVSSDNPFGDVQDKPVGKLQVVKHLVSWNENGNIEGQSYGEIQLVQYLLGWNEARG